MTGVQTCALPICFPVTIIEVFVVLTTDWSNYFNTVSQVKFQLFEMSGSTFNIPVSFSVITGFSGGLSYSPSLT